VGSAPADVGFIGLNVFVGLATDPIRVRPHHAGAQLVQNLSCLFGSVLGNSPAPCSNVCKCGAVPKSKFRAALPTIGSSSTSSRCFRLPQWKSPRV
jgi:hypothetical protein